MKIYKHMISSDDGRLILSCAGVLSAIEQDGSLVVYAFNDEDRNEDYIIQAIGTGWELDKELGGFTFLSSVKCGSFVWHVFYRKRRMAV